MNSAPDGRTPASEPRRYTRGEIALHDGSVAGRPVLFAYRGKVYDVTASYQWAKGSHWGVSAGRELSEQLCTSIHGEELLERVPCVGVLAD